MNPTEKQIEKSLEEEKNVSTSFIQPDSTGSEPKKIEMANADKRYLKAKDMLKEHGEIRKEIKEQFTVKKALEKSSEILTSYEKNPQKIADFLHFRSKHNFYNYSLRNTMLMENQNPGTTFAGSYQKWKELGCHVLKGQKGMKVLVPAQLTLFKPVGSEKYKKLSQANPQEKQAIQSGQIQTVKKNTYVIGHVFDIAQTNFPKERYPELITMGISSQKHEQAYHAMKGYLQEKQIDVQEADFASATLRGRYLPEISRIEINHLLNDTEKLSTLCHEAGHALLQHDKMYHLPASVHECQADAFAICLQSYLGLDLTETRMDHFKDHFEACKDVKGFTADSLLKEVSQRFNDYLPELEQHLQPVMENQQHMSADFSMTQQMH
ncbi:ImmA/IrrE family metallo-endopeptidase [Scatolibacter rhodanostii]|uniref:ImmA/IrrE family metallo-endopeptidase n=1 Tax=Scatolibacter rhodanostii TaxID=2014781 RepID=UPI0013563187|nr:ImmA/IrrE family metallo-endopeptidase [Scatolibacter rhodanostii]